MENHEIKVDKNLCIGCGLCASICVAHNIDLHCGKANIISENCIMCGHCSAVCPTKAIYATGYEDEQVEKLKEVQLNPQEVLDVIRFRRSIRQFQKKSIPLEIIEQVLEAGRLTHTAKNMQDVSYVVLDKEKDVLEKMAISVFKKAKLIADLLSPMAKRNQISDHFFFFEAPIVIVVLAKDKTNGLLAAQNMEFVAEANGLGVLFSGFFTMAANVSFKMKKALHIPRGKKVAATLVLGYPKVKYLRSPHREKLDVRYM